MALTRYGYLPGGAYTQDGYDQSTQIAQALPAPGAPVWLVKAGTQLKNLMPSSTIAFAVWRGATPGTLLGTSDRYGLPFGSTEYTSERALASPILQASGQPIAIGHLIKGTPSGDAWDFATLANGAGGASYYRLGVGGISDPFGAASPTYRQGLRIWVWGQVNRAPDVPTNIGPAHGATVTTGTPTIAADFRDADEVLRDDGGATLFGLGQADKLTSYQIRVTQGGVTKWDSGAVTASGTEQAARRLSRACAVTLPSGLYDLAIRVQDRAGAWSGWSASSFTVSVARVDVTSPTGKITSQTPAFGWQYTNSTADTANRITVRLKKAGGVVATSPDLTISAAPGATGSITWASTGFTALDQGADYVPELRVRYGAANLWTPWLPGAAFRVNGPPNKPPVPSPNGQTIGRPAYPTITAQLSDADDAAGTLTATVEITRPDSSVLTMTTGGNDGAGRWTQATTVTQFGALNGTYKVRVQARDPFGLLGPWSDYATITWGEYPAVTIAAITPATGGNITGAPFTIDFKTNGSDTPSATEQYSWFIQIYSADGKTKLYELGWQYNQTTIATISPGAWFHNGGDYVVLVGVANNLGLIGVATQAIHVAYTPPASLTGVAALPVRMAGDFQDMASGVQVQWDASTLAPSAYLGTLIRRDGQLVATLTNQALTTWLDPQPPAGQALAYTVTQKAQVLEAQIESNPATASVTLTFTDLVVSDAYDPAMRAAIRYQDGEPEETNIGDAVKLPVSGAKPWIVQGLTDYAEFTVRARLLPYGDPTVSPEEQVATMRALGRIVQNGDGTFRPRVVCVRNGGRDFRRFMWADKPRIRPGRLLGTYTVEWTFTEVDQPDGVA